ncbi:hypothetical protein ES708_22578 [subsurface metagenome]
MTFIARIAEKIWDIGEWFWDAYLEVKDWIYPFRLLADPLYEIQRYFGRLTYDIDDFGEWLDDALSQVVETLSWSNIRSLIRSWLPDIEDLVDWFQYWYYWVRQEIDDWWASEKLTVLWWIFDIKSWALTQINNAVEGITQVVTNVYDYSQTIINNVTEYITEVYNNVYDYSQTTINNITENISNFITNVYDYTQTIINNITETITELIDWDRVTTFINDWWSDRLLDIQLLFDSWTLTLAPFWEGWQDVKDSVVEFFADPVEFVWARFTNWFLGPEE